MFLFKNCETRIRVENRTNARGWLRADETRRRADKRRERGAKRRIRGGEEKQAVRREVAAGSTNSVLSRRASSGHRESLLLLLLHGALRPSPALAARREGAPSSPLSPLVSAPAAERPLLRSMVGYTSACAPGAIFRATMGARRGPSSFFFHAA